jgi:hypothetical protein
MDDEVWGTGKCPDCNGELSAEPYAAEGHLAIAYSCTAHGPVAVMEPF